MNETDCIVDIKLTLEDLIRRGERLARELGFACFDDVIKALDEGRIARTADELEARGIRHLMGK